MKNYTANITRLCTKTTKTLSLIAGAMFVLILPVNADSVTYNLFGDFGDFDNFGSTGLEFGSFSGTFSYDLSAIDLADSSSTLGIYGMTSWSLDFFDASGVFAGQMNNTNTAARGEVIISVDSGTPGNDESLSLEFYEEDNPLSSAILFAMIFNLGGVTTDALPSDLNAASYADFGLFIDSSGFDPASTIVETATITPVPIPPALILFGSGLLAFIRFTRRVA